MTFAPDELTPQRVVEELDKYIVGQHAAKRSVAIALRNRWRRQQIDSDLQREIMPNNIILIGPTGVGKTEIARRLSRLANAPFIKVEASKFTEVGYVGRDVESMVRELMSNAVNQIRHQMLENVQLEAYDAALNRVLDLLVPVANSEKDPETAARKARTREKMLDKLISGKLDDREVEFKAEDIPSATLELLNPQSMDMAEFDISEMISGLFPGQNKKKRLRMSVKEAIDYFMDKEANRMVSKEKVVEAAREAVENDGIIFIDEIDKIASPDRHGQVDVSRSGVQRDLLPIVEGSVVPTKYGPIDTCHVLFIAAGAFHTAKPSDLIPELQGRFPIRVELNSLTQADFERILVEPENALIKQYQALFAADGCKLSFSKDAVAEIARYAALANEKMEDIGARRLHTIMNTLLDEYLFDMPNPTLTSLKVTPKLVRAKMARVIESDDLARFIL